MRIAVFYSLSPWASWSMSEGLVSTLNHMGHQARACPIPAAEEISGASFNHLKASLPALDKVGGAVESLDDFDLILVSGPEHLAPWLDAVYGRYAWKNSSVPKAGWYHESRQRSDGGWINFDEVFWAADEHFFPACQDAEFYDQEHFVRAHCHWLPFGVDTEVFKPCSDACSGVPSPGIALQHGHWFEPLPKLYDLAFIGLLYDRRAAFLNALARHDHPPIRIGNVAVQDLGGFRARETAERYAQNIRQTKVFLNLPSLSQLVVSKVYEVLACGTFLLTPMFGETESVRRNMTQFVSGEDLIFYRPAHLGGLAQALREWTGEEKVAEREAIARAGCEEVHAKHRLEQRLQTILATVSAAPALVAVQADQNMRQGGG